MLRNQRSDELGYFGIASRDQALAAGTSRKQIAANLKSGRWQGLHRAVYATHNGPIAFQARVHAAVLAAGSGAAASHRTAAILVGLINVSSTADSFDIGEAREDDGRDALIHVTVQHGRRVAAPRGVRIHVSRRLDVMRHPSRIPAQTRIEETVLDLVDLAADQDAVVGWLATACGKRLTTPDRILAVLVRRPRARWRALAMEALGDVRAGTHSVLERRYMCDVERAHGLPRGQRQAPHDRPGGRIYDDVWYTAFRTVVELDGRVAHPALQRSRDLRRDNIAVVRGDSVLHFIWSDIARTPCATAAQVATVLRLHGWRGVPRRCGPTCMIGEF